MGLTCIFVVQQAPRCPESAYSEYGFLDCARPCPPLTTGSCVRNTTAQISSSVFLAGNWDYMDWYKNGSSNCISMVDKCVVLGDFRMCLGQLGGGTMPSLRVFPGMLRRYQSPVERPGFRVACPSAAPSAVRNPIPCATTELPSRM